VPLSSAQASFVWSYAPFSPELGYIRRRSPLLCGYLHSLLNPQFPLIVPFWIPTDRRPPLLGNSQKIALPVLETHFPLWTPESTAALFYFWLRQNLRNSPKDIPEPVFLANPPPLLVYSPFFSLEVPSTWVSDLGGFKLSLL